MKSDHNSSSENHDQQPAAEEIKSTGDSAGIGRSYECTFCKRGFTNAQALGGHMNIHRKDKAKAIKNQESYNSSSNTHHNLSKVMNINDQSYSNLMCNFPNITSTDHHHHYQQQQQQTSHVYYRPVGGQVNYQEYLMPSSNPSFQAGNYSPTWRPDNFEGRLDLRIGLSLPDEDGEEGEDSDKNVAKNEVDLELRLGHDP